jgi:hypothetical protein
MHRAAADVPAPLPWPANPTTTGARRRSEDIVAFDVHRPVEPERIAGRPVDPQTPGRIACGARDAVGGRSVARRRKRDGSNRSIGIAPYHRAMSPHSRRRSTTRPASDRPFAARLVGLALALVLAVVLAGCSDAAFDPNGPCAADGSTPGAYPSLEAAVPTDFKGAKPTQLDSGRVCTSDGLGTLAGHGITEIRFAGGTWQTGTQSGVSLAVFTTADGSPLDAGWVEEFYEAGARAGKNVQQVDPSQMAVGSGITASRIDVLNGDSYQTIVVWPRRGQVAVALIADYIQEIQTKDAHEAVVQAAVSTLGQ